VGAGGKQVGASFLKKKKQKNLIPWSRGMADAAYTPRNKKFFASFCSQKEDLA
jgi:hypothetical protein